MAGGAFTTGVGVAADGATLTLTSGDVTIVLTRAPDGDLQELFGKTWSAVATMSDGRRPGSRGGSYAAPGCRPERPEPTGHRLQLRAHHRHPDATSITFGHPAVTRRRCQEPERTIEQRVLSVVDGRSDYVTFDGSVLVVVKGDQGLVFQVR